MVVRFWRIATCRNWQQTAKSGRSAVSTKWVRDSITYRPDTVLATTAYSQAGRLGHGIMGLRMVHQCDQITS